MEVEERHCWCCRGECVPDYAYACRSARFSTLLLWLAVDRGHKRQTFSLEWQQLDIENLNNFVSGSRH